MNNGVIEGVVLLLATAGVMAMACAVLVAVREFLQKAKALPKNNT